MTLTQQQVFSRVWQHFVEEGAPRSFVTVDSRRQVCKYRGKDGARCAVGLFMTDREAKAGDASGSGVFLILQRGGCAELEGQQVGFMDEMQQAHDKARDGNIRECLEIVAEQYALEAVGC